MANLTYDEYLMYDKIKDDVYVLGTNAILRFSVTLSKYSGSNRYHYYKEFAYNRGNTPIVSIQRSFDAYLSIENISKPAYGGDKAFIRIGPAEQFYLYRMLQEAFSWFTDEKYSDLFIRAGGKLTIAAGNIPVSTINNLPQNKFLTLYPIVIDKGLGIDMLERGVRLVLSDEDNFVDMDFNHLVGFLSILTNFNIYTASLGLLNFIGIPYGLNRYEMSGFQKPDNAPSVEGANGRMIDPITLDDM
jgi:hypothetical protein